MNIKKILALLLALAMMLSLCACGSTTPDKDAPTELIVFAAASLTEALTELGNK